MKLVISNRHLVHWMEGRGITTRDLSKRTGVNIYLVRRYVEDKAPINEDHLKIFAKILNCLPDDIRSTSYHDFRCTVCGISESDHKTNDTCYVGRNGRKEMKFTPEEYPEGSRSRCTFCVKAGRSWCYKCY